MARTTRSGAAAVTRVTAAGQYGHHRDPTGGHRGCHATPTARFEPQIVNKHQRRLSGIDEILLALPAKGLTTGEIAVDFADVYDYLGVLAEPAAVDKLVAKLKSALIVYKKPKISCAPLGCGCCPSTTRTSNPTSQKSRSAKLFSSIMLVSGDLTTGVPPINRGMAPGYGRRRLSWRSGQGYEALGAVNLRLSHGVGQEQHGSRITTSTLPKNPIARTATESATRAPPREQARNCRQGSTHAHPVQRCSPAQLSQQLVGPSRL